MKFDLEQRFGFLVAEVAKLHGDLLDKKARSQIGLSRAQCRVLGVLAANTTDNPLSQADIAARLDLTPMAVVTLCIRMESAGWLRRVPSHSDGRVKHVFATERGMEALCASLHVSNRLTKVAFSKLTQEHQDLLLASLRSARDQLSSYARRS